MPAVKKTHTLEVPVNHSLAMDVDQALSDVRQLNKPWDLQYTAQGENYEKLTGLNRSASGCAFTKSLMFPFPIQSDTIAN